MGSETRDLHDNRPDLEGKERRERIKKMVEDMVNEMVGKLSEKDDYYSYFGWDDFHSQENIGCYHTTPGDIIGGVMRRLVDMKMSKEDLELACGYIISAVEKIRPNGNEANEQKRLLDGLVLSFVDYEGHKDGIEKEHHVRMARIQEKREQK